MIVYLSLNRDRSDPHWRINQLQLSYLMHHLEMPGSTEDANIPQPPPPPGYGGLIAYTESEHPSLFRNDFYVYKGITLVRVDGNRIDRKVFCSDTNRSLEKWLLSTGREHIDADTYNRVLKEIEAHS